MSASKTSPKRDAREHRQAFPLISIVQLSTFCVALVTCIDSRTLSQLLDRVPLTEWPIVVAPIVGAGLIGLLIGSVIGLGQIRRWQSVVLCGATGGIVSVLLLAALAAPAKPAQAIAAVLLPLVSTIILRHRSP